MAFLDEVKEQPQVLKKLIGYYRSDGAAVIDKACALVREKDTRCLKFLGMGTSFFAPVVIEDLLHKGLQTPFSVHDAGEFLHYSIGTVQSSDTVIGISQSGESIETRKCFESLKGNSNLIAVTNDTNSTMAKLAAVTLPLLAGDEASISNKTYTNTLAVLLILAYRLTGKDTAPLFDLLECCIESMNAFYAQRQEEINAVSGLLKDTPDLQFVGRGPSLIAAQQASLTWMEGVHMYTAPLSGGAFRHGPFELVGKGHHAVMYAPEGNGGALIEKVAREAASLGSRIAVLSGRKMKPADNLVVVELEPGDEHVFPIVSAVPQELLLAKMASNRGLVAGHFARGSKITNVE